MPLFVGGITALICLCTISGQDPIGPPHYLIIEAGYNRSQPCYCTRIIVINAVVKCDIMIWDVWIWQDCTIICFCINNTMRFCAEVTLQNRQCQIRHKYSDMSCCWFTKEACMALILHGWSTRKATLNQVLVITSDHPVAWTGAVEAWVLWYCEAKNQNIFASSGEIFVRFIALVLLLISFSSRGVVHKRPRPAVCAGVILCNPFSFIYVAAIRAYIVSQLAFSGMCA